MQSWGAFGRKAALHASTGNIPIGNIPLLSMNGRRLADCDEASDSCAAMNSAA